MFGGGFVLAGALFLEAEGMEHDSGGVSAAAFEMPARENVGVGRTCFQRRGRVLVECSSVS